MPAIFVMLLAACAGRYQAGLPPGQIQSAGRQGYYQVGAPYEVNGVWYYPAVDYHYDRTGIASWYGPDYDGRLTANGEIFNMNGLSAAHPTLPLPSIVRVTNLENGRSLDLRVNDRGPFVDGRILDVSRYAAQALGFESQGIAPVRVTILPRRSLEVAELARRGIISNGTAFAEAAPPAMPAPDARTARAASYSAAAPPQIWQPRAEITAANLPPVGVPAAAAEIRPQVNLVSYRPPPRPNVSPATYRPPAWHAVAAAAARPTGRIFVQAGAFSVPENAWRVRARVAGLAGVEVSAVEAGGVRIYRVRLGPFVNVEQADRILSRLAARGYPGARMVFD
jgi:rare lipoprotein A